MRAGRRRPRTSISTSVPGSARSARTYARPAPTSRHGRERAAGNRPRDLAAGEHGVALAGDARPREDERGEALGGAGLAGGRHRLGADEARVLLAAPPEPGLDRIAVLAQVIAVEVEADLEPQGVAGGRAPRASPRPPAARPRGRAPRRAGRGSRLRPLPCSPCRRPGPRRRRPRAAKPVRIRAGSSEPRTSPAIVRASGPCTASIAHSEIESATSASNPSGMLAKPPEVALVVGRVGDRQVAILGEAVGEQVVEDAAVLPAEHRVLGAADLELRDVVGEQSLKQVEGAGPRGLDLAHVGDVEHPAAGPHRDVLCAHSLVLDWHLPAGEVHQLRAGGDVGVVEGRPPQHAAQASGGVRLVCPGGTTARRCRPRRPAGPGARCRRGPRRCACASARGCGWAYARGSRSPRTRWR